MARLYQLSVEFLNILCSLFPIPCSLNKMAKIEQRFDYVKIGIASPERIRQWGERTLPNGQVVGEVTKPETINYRNPETRDGRAIL